MNHKKHLIINLSGSLTSNLGESVLEKIEPIAHTLKAIIFDFKEIDSVTDEGIINLKKTIFHLREFGCEIAFAGIKEEFDSLMQNQLDRTIFKVFALKDEAKNYLEEKLESTEEEIPVVPEIKEVRSALFKEGSYYTYCPSCNVKLRLKSRGNYKCPSCSNKFIFNPIQDSVKYEKISLE